MKLFRILDPVYGNPGHRCPVGLILPGPWRFRPLL